MEILKWRSRNEQTNTGPCYSGILFDIRGADALLLFADGCPVGAVTSHKSHGDIEMEIGK